MLGSGVGTGAGVGFGVVLPSPSVPPDALIVAVASRLLPLIVARFV